LVTDVRFTATALAPAAPPALAAASQKAGPATDDAPTAEEVKAFERPVLK
jgi:hypothetical protein